MRIGALAIAFLVAACAREEAEPRPAVQEDAGPSIPTCADNALPTLAGACKIVGVDRCDEGLEADGRGGCRAILPDTCAVGQLALPGERTCRPIDDCATAEVPSDAIFVDASGGPAGNGASGKPFRTITEALALAKTRGSGTIAIAKGTYVEGLVPQVPVKLIGACATSVELVAPEGASSFAFASAFPFELHRLSVRGAGAGGIYLVGQPVAGAPAEASALIDRVWVRSSKSIAIGASTDARVLSLTIRDSLIEDGVDSGVALVGAKGVIERTVIRGIASGSVQGSSGVYVAGPTASLTMRRSLIEHASHGAGILGGDVRIEGSVFRDLRRTEGVISGSGVSAEGAKTTLHMSGSLIERAELAGVLVSRATATIERTTVREILAGSDLGVGEGVQIVRSGKLSLRDSLIDTTRALGVFLADGEATLERTIVRDTQPRPVEKDFGAGIAAQPDRGASRLVLRDVVVRSSYVAGIQINGATLELDSAFVTDVRAQEVDKLFGDALAVQSALRRATGELLVGTATVRGLIVRNAARAGIGVFGASLDLSASALQCNAIDLALTERFDSSGVATNPPVLRDGGDNVCGCETVATCAARSEALTPAPTLPK
jgi:hypothetical protein